MCHDTAVAVSRQFCLHQESCGDQSQAISLGSRHLYLILSFNNGFNEPVSCTVVPGAESLSVRVQWFSLCAYF